MDDNRKEVLTTWLANRETQELIFLVSKLIEEIETREELHKAIDAETIERLKTIKNKDKDGSN